MTDLRPATSVETSRIWPAIRGARIFADLMEFTEFRDRSPWRVRVSDDGEALVVAPWREHLDLLAIRGLWAAPDRVPALIDAAAALARTQGFAAVVSPLLTPRGFEDYRRAGLIAREHIIALQGFAAEVRPVESSYVAEIRRAAAEDLSQIAAVDAECFDEFWRYGPEEIGDSLGRERMTVAVDSTGEIVGYATCSLHGASATLGRLAVARQSRRRGVGRSLLADAAQWAARRDSYAITLCTQQTNRASRQLYAAAGLCEVPEPYVIGVREA